jgi:gluconate 2-dehydrogenase gamma chain
MSAKQPLMRRRKFVRAGAATAISAAVGCNRSRSPWRFFTAQEAFTMEAVCQRLIPADQDLGAREAGVVNYIDRQLTRHYRRFQTIYRAGITRVDEISRKLHGSLFGELDEERQLTVLAEIEKQERAFFDLVLAHAMQGFYGDPRHGGNRDWVSWRMLGVSPLPVRGRRHYDLTRKG